MRVQTTIRYCFVGGERKRFFLKGIPKKGALSVLSPDKFKTTNHRPGIYLATCGTVGVATLKNINHILSRLSKKHQKTKLYLCLDNDEAGQKAASKIEENCTKTCLEINKITPQNKDFAEDLAIKNK